MAITLEQIKISICSFQGYYSNGPGYWLMMESNTHTFNTLIPILMGYYWMGPKPLELYKLNPSHNTPGYLKT